jgi:hypothetical protein
MFMSLLARAVTPLGERHLVATAVTFETVQPVGYLCVEPEAGFPERRY